MFKYTTPNHTQVSNDLLDSWLPHLKEVELKVLLVIIRKIIGYHKVRDRISLSQLSEITGSHINKVSLATKALQKKGIINKIVVGKKGSQQTYYELATHDNSNNSDHCQIGSPPTAKLADTKETLTKEKKNTLRVQKAEPPPDPVPKSHSPSPSGLELANILFSSVKKRKPNMKLPKLTKWAQAMDELLQLGRTPEEIKAMIAWVESDDYAKTWVNSASRLREDFDDLILKKELSDKKIRMAINRKFALQMQQKYRKELKSMSFEAKWVHNNENGESIMWDLPEESFKNAFASMFGATHE